jgi:hypothetical protein
MTDKKKKVKCDYCHSEEHEIHECPLWLAMQTVVVLI